MRGGMAGLGLHLRMVVDGVEHVAYEPNLSEWSGTFFVGDTRGRLPDDLKDATQTWLERNTPSGILVRILPYTERPQSAEEIDGRSNQSMDRIVRAGYWTGAAMQAMLARRFPALRWTLHDRPDGPGVVLTLDHRCVALLPEVLEYVRDVWPEWRIDVVIADAAITIPEYRVTPPAQGITAPARWQSPAAPFIEQYAQDADDWFDSTVADILDKGMSPHAIVPDALVGTGQVAWLPGYGGVGLAESLALYDRVFIGLIPDSPVLQEADSVAVLHRLAQERRVIPVFLHPLARYPEPVMAPFLRDHIPCVLPRQLDALVLAGAVRRNDLWIRMRLNPDEAQALLRATHQAQLLRDDAPGMDLALAVMQADLETMVDAAVSLDENVWEKGWTGMLWGLPGSPLLHLTHAMGREKTAWAGLMPALLEMAVGDSLGAVVIGSASEQWAKLVANVGYRGLQWGNPRSTPRVDTLSSASEILHGLQLAVPYGWTLDEYATIFNASRTAATRAAIRELIERIDSPEGRSGALTAIRVAVDRLNRDILDAVHGTSRGRRTVKAINQYLQPVSLLVGLGLTAAHIGNPVEQWLVNDAVNGALLAVTSLAQDKQEELVERVLEFFGVDLGNPSRLLVLHETQQALVRPSVPPGLDQSAVRSNSNR